MNWLYYNRRLHLWRVIWRGRCPPFHELSGIGYRLGRWYGVIFCDILFSHLFYRWQFAHSVIVVWPLYPQTLYQADHFTRC